MRRIHPLPALTALLFLTTGCASGPDDGQDASEQITCEALSCDASARCVETAGADARCECAEGFVGDGTTCVDEDECDTGAAACHADATCTNTPGGFTCACKPGWDGDGIECTAREDNWCATNNGGCDLAADCAYAGPNEVDCTCKDGFEGDGFLCADLNECLVDRGGCHDKAVCRNLPGTHECRCLPGFTGDGTTCEDIDECAQENGGCDPRATCENLEGARICTCPATDQGDGLVCGPITWTGVDTGATVSCGVKSDGSVWCWGRNACGQLGREEPGTHPEPNRVGLDLDWSRVSAGDDYVCGLKTDGSLYCWGCAAGALGVEAAEDTFVPTAVGGSIRFEHLEAGPDQACAIDDEGAVWCWGDAGSAVPVRVGDGPYVTLAVGKDHACAITVTGRLDCWGANDRGQLGQSDTSANEGLQTVAGTWTRVGAGDGWTCALAAGRLSCWGTRAGNEAMPGPTPIGEATWSTLAVGGAFACLIAIDGSLHCFGDNTFGQLATGQQTPADTPVPSIDTTAAWDEVQLAGAHGCGRRGPQLACWGENSNGQLGDGTTETRFRPRVIAP